mmetsp:Transcript_22452/g.39669  ORF Transcript_22452/g.39669 Transcript_22452/m.39669 type:complete len:369 (+) Transcript_22452:95-1201(+)
MPGLVSFVSEMIQTAQAVALAGFTAMASFFTALRSAGSRRIPSGPFASMEKAALEDEKAIRRCVPTKVGNRVLEGDLVHFDGGVSSRKLFLFFPGNPGLVDFYLTMLRQIYTRMDEKVHVVAISHAGHSSWTPGDHAPISYQEQIKHKLAVLNQEVPWFADKDAQVFVSGHSVGARVGLEIMHEMPKVKWTRYIGICPTVMFIGQSPNGVKLSPLLNKPWLRSLAYMALHPVSMIVGMMPGRVKHALVKTVMEKDCPGVDDHYVSHGIKLVNPTVIQNVLNMANDEMKEILDVDHFDDTILKPHMDKMTFVLSPIDRWCHHEIVERMHKAFPKAYFHVLPGTVTHAFCLSHENVNLVVDAVQTALERD